MNTYNYRSALFAITFLESQEEKLGTQGTAYIKSLITLKRGGEIEKNINTHFCFTYSFQVSLPSVKSLWHISVQFAAQRGCYALEVPAWKDLIISDKTFCKCECYTIIFTTTRKVVLLSLVERRDPGNYMIYSHISATLFTLKLPQHASEVASGKHVPSLLYYIYQTSKDESFLFPE